MYHNPPNSFKDHIREMNKSLPFSFFNCKQFIESYCYCIIAAEWRLSRRPASSRTGIPAARHAADAAQPNGPNATEVSNVTYICPTFNRPENDYIG